MMEATLYTQELKRKQIKLLDQYQELIQKGMGSENWNKENYLKTFQQKEKSLMSRLEHLNKVIDAFPPVEDEILDDKISEAYKNTKTMLQSFMSQIQDKNLRIKHRRKSFSAKVQRNNRLYREINPTYIDIRT